MGRLKKISSILLAAALLFAMAVPAAAEATGDAQNLFLNGDFEGDTIDGTIGSAKDSAIVDLSEEEGITGRTGKALKIVKETAADKAEAYYSKKFDFKDGHRYLLRFWYYCPQATLSAPEGAEKVPAIKGKVNDSNKTYEVRDAWTLVESSFNYAEGKGETVYVIRIQNCNAGATVYIDDLLLVDLTEAAFDGSMETNDKWTVSGEASINAEGGAYEGEGMMMLDGKTTVSQIAYMGAVAGSDYMLKGLVKTDEGYQKDDAEIRVYAGVKDAGSAPIFKKSIDVTPVWSEVLADNLIANTNKVMTVEIENKGGACVYFDAFTLGKTTNLVPNSGFEREQADSETSKWPNAKRSYNDAKNGAYSLKNTSTSTTGTDVAINGLPCKPDTEYRLSFGVKRGAEETCSSGYFVSLFKADGTVLNEKIISSNNIGTAYYTGNWETYTKSFKTPAEAASIKITLRTRIQAGTIYYDDVCLYEVYPHENAFRTADGEGIYEVHVGMPTTFTAKYAWTAEEAGTCLFVVGLYKEVSGKKSLEKVFLKDCDYTAGDTLLSQDITWDAVNMEDGATYTMKCMVWEDITTLNPAGKVYSIRSY